MSQAVFLTGNLMRHVAVMSSTASIGILAVFAVDFVDVMFIAMLGKAELAAAVGYAGTLLFFTNSINIGLSIAAGSLVARAIGAYEAERARRLATSVAMLAALVSLLVPMVVVPNLPSILSLLGAEGATLDFATRYCTIILPTMICMGLAMTSMAVLRAYGAAKASMLTTLGGGVVNAILDPILIFGLDLGLDGAAYASVVARAFMMAGGIWLVVSRCNGYARPSLSAVSQDLRPMLAIAGPAVLTNLATPVGNAIVTREMAKYGTDAVAAMAVIGRLTPLAFAVVLALSGAIGPIIGQNFGAGRLDRVRRAFLDGLLFVGLYVLFVSVLLFLLRDLIAGMFNATGEMAALLFLFCGPLALLQFFNGALFVCNASFNNLGKPIYSTALNWARHTIGTLPFVLLGASFAGAAGVLAGQAFGGILFALVGILAARRLMTNLEPAPNPDSFEGEEKRLHQVTGQRVW
ncbi:MATE family efflux transporter [Roseibium sediminis]|uniref:MATE family efflux transporter n=1 Tax=Roseibium sediminis TaxID=1775174 RepID=UPI001AD9485F|nr:MATE family efflux transporter [Roseibium sediminis]